MTQKTVTCYIYRCTRKPDTYVYLAEKDDFSCLPEAIFGSLGTLEYSMELELHTDRKLAREDAGAVMDNLAENGFHLQLPDAVPVEELMARIARGKA